MLVYLKIPNLHKDKILFRIVVLKSMIEKHKTTKTLFDNLELKNDMSKLNWKSNVN